MAKMKKAEIKKYLEQALTSLENMHKPSYDKKAWRHNLILCLEKIINSTAE